MTSTNKNIDLFNTKINKKNQLYKKIHILYFMESNFGWKMMHSRSSGIIPVKVKHIPWSFKIFELNSRFCWCALRGVIFC